MPDRTYSEEEVADLFKRTAELQAQRDSSSSAAASHRPGLTLEEITAIAADAGLDPAHLRAAAAELEPRGRRRKAETRVSTSEIVAERWIPGILDDVAKEDLIAELRHRHDMSSGETMGMGSYGKSSVQTIGRSVEWQHTNPWWGTHKRVLVQPRDEGVRIRVMQNNAYSGTATGWSNAYTPLIALALGFFAAPAAGSFLIGVAVALVALAVLTPVIGTISKRSADRQRAEVEHLADDIAAHVSRPAAPLPAPHQTGGEAFETGLPAIDLPEGEAEDQAGRSRQRARER